MGAAPGNPGRLFIFGELLVICNITDTIQNYLHIVTIVTEPIG